MFSSVRLYLLSSPGITEPERFIKVRGFTSIILLSLQAPSAIRYFLKTGFRKAAPVNSAILSTVKNPALCLVFLYCSPGFPRPIISKDRIILRYLLILLQLLLLLRLLLHLKVLQLLLYVQHELQSDHQIQGILPLQ